MKYLCIDIGSTSIKYAESENGKLPEKVSKTPFPEPLPLPEPFYEADAEKIFSIVKKIIDSSSAEAVMFSVQMHGYVLADKRGGLLTGYISWRDKRAGLKPYGFSLSPEHGVKLKYNLPRASVIVTAMLFPEIAKEAEVFYTLGSYLAFRLTGNNVTHITDAAASGFYNCITGRVDFDEKDYPVKLSLPTAFTEVKPAGVYNGKTIYTPVGDQQATILGLGENDCYILNLGTAAQMCETGDIFLSGDFECRPFFDGKFLYTVTGLYGGGYIRENSRQKAITQILVSNYKTALEKLPEKNELVVTGGTLEYHKDLIFGVLKELNVKSRIAGKVDAINGLCYLAKVEEK